MPRRLGARSRWLRASGLGLWRMKHRRCWPSMLWLLLRWLLLLWRLRRGLLLWRLPSLRRQLLWLLGSLDSLDRQWSRGSLLELLLLVVQRNQF